MRMYRFLPEDERCTLVTSRSVDSIVVTEDLSKGKYRKLDTPMVLTEGNNIFRKECQFDFLWLYADGILCNEKAYIFLKNYLIRCGYWNTMFFDKKKWYYFSTTLKLPALDQKRSALTCFDGFVVDVNKYVFNNLDYSNTPIFRLDNLIAHYPIVTNDFIDFLHCKNLKGLKFEKLL